MALLGREFIAVPDSHKNQLVYKWPDVSIRRYTRAIVAADELALFVNTGKVVQTMYFEGNPVQKQGPVLYRNKVRLALPQVLKIDAGKL